MTLNIQTDAPPLRVTKDGVVYVGQTRVPLETVIYMFREGASAEERRLSIVSMCCPWPMCSPCFPII